MIGMDVGNMSHVTIGDSHAKQYNIIQLGVRILMRNTYVRKIWKNYFENTVLFCIFTYFSALCSLLFVK